VTRSRTYARTGVHAVDKLCCRSLRTDCGLQLCNGNLDDKFRLEVWDYDAASSPDMIGWLDVSLNDLLKKEPIQLNDRPGGRTANPGI
jgi:hypothetical protein